MPETGAALGEAGGKTQRENPGLCYGSFHN